MLVYHSARLRTKISRFSLQWNLALTVSLLLFLLTSVQSSAHKQTNTLRHDLLLRATIGFQKTYRENYWTPIDITLTNNGTDFTGNLEVKAFTGYSRLRNVSNVSPWKFVQPITIPAKGHQQLTVYAPFYLGNIIPLGFMALLLDKQGNTITTQTTDAAYGVKPGDLFIGVLSDISPNFTFTALNNVILPYQADSLTQSPLDASSFPGNSAVLKNFDIIILDDFNTKALSNIQLTALQAWVNQGGTLIEVGGTDWQRTLSPLPTTLLPVQVNGIQTVRTGTNLLPVDSTVVASNTGSAPVTGKLATSISTSTATLRTSGNFYASQTLQSTGTIPLIVQAQQGQGTICYVAFDLARDPLISWTGSETLWTALLLHTQNDKILVNATPSTTYENDLGQLLTQGGIVRMLVPDKLLEPGLVLALLLGYVLMLGPIRLLIVRRLKQPKQWAWNITLIVILVFSLLSYSIAAYQKKALQVDNTVSLIQLAQAGSAAHILTYHGLIIPDQGPITLNLANSSLTFPLSSPIQTKTPLPGPSSDPQASITLGQNQTRLTLPVNQRWTFNPLVSEKDTQLSGALIPHLTLHNNRVSGTITNTLSSTLSDVYILFPGYFVKVGYIEAGETQQLNLQLHSAPFGGPVFADVIAKEGGLKTPYFPYSQNASASSDFERHMALLAALNGAGMSVSACSGACNLHTMKNQNSIVLADAPLDDNKVNTTYDPLLIPGAPATLIGWADQPLDGTNTSILNGGHAGGRHENFVQMPVSLTIHSVTDAPAGLLMGNTVAIQGSQAQFLLPGIYGLLASNLLFEFSVPEGEKTQNRNLTIKIPVQWKQLSGQILPESSIQTHLYNWQTNSWDKIAEHHGTVTITNSTIYVGVGRQLLLEIINPENTQGPLIFGKPSLSAISK